ncbi:hypothetical protein [Kitasatospora sp. NPDC006786]|uniref:hypothetical protein n=1 Tax=unclassified Kitasatospora TaxID=2633591 RepID=UPI00340C4346
MTDTPATPLAAARALHLAVLREGGRVRSAEVGGEDGSALLRLVELGLPVPQLVDGSDSAVDPRAVGERIGGDLRRTGTRLLAEAGRIPGQLRERTRAHGAAPRRSEPGGGVRRLRGTAEIRHLVSQLVKDYPDHPHEALGARPGGLFRRAHRRVRPAVDAGRKAARPRPHAAGERRPDGAERARGGRSCRPAA